jgi:hypothetical protein
MSRRLTGTKKQTATGWHASLPTSRGATKRQGYTFRTEYAADRWLAAGRTAITAGEPLPEPVDTDLAAGSPDPAARRHRLRAGRRPVGR